MKPLVALTGPGGRVGRAILPVWGDRYRLRLLYRNRLPDVPPDTEVMRGDVTDLETLTELCRGADCLVHLAAHPGEADFTSVLLPNNVVGAYHAFEAARRAGVPRVIFASSGQVGGGYPPCADPAARADENSLPRPITLYACTKLWGEALGLHYSQIHGLSVICIRMGWCDDREVVRHGGDEANCWISDRDLAEALAIAIEAPAEVRYLLSYAVSDNARALWNCEPLRRLGWQPQDRLEDWL
ncbi:MAG: NAD(P)-dependent oxidoreductase [Armatimonadetes bacterium]|jgi:uronate dehydrogenase|nr:NAD(P)-dependent oxidoreductase [Armatimonadota bacterium]